MKQNKQTKNIFSNVYHNIQEKHIRFLPEAPITLIKNSKIFVGIILILKRIEFRKIPEKIIREELVFYQKNHKKLEDLQIESDLEHLFRFLIKTEKTKGDVLELGTYRGGSAILMSDFLKRMNSRKKIFACDGFVGLPYDDKFSRDENSKGKFSDTNYQYVKEKFQKFEVDKNIEIIKGLFEETLELKLNLKKFSFVMIDCDIYDSTIQALDFIFPRLQKDGIIFFQNYSRKDVNNPRWGETRAVNDFFGKKNLSINEKPVPYFIKQ